MKAPYKVESFPRRSGWGWAVIDRRDRAEERIYTVKTWITAMQLIRDLDRSRAGLMPPWEVERWAYVRGYWGKVTW